MNKFDQQIKNKLTQQQLPPLDAWKNIEEQLDDKKKKRVIPFIFWISSSAACLGIAGVTYFLNSKEYKSDDTKIVKENRIEKLPETNLKQLPNSKDPNNIINIVNNSIKDSKSKDYNNKSNVVSYIEREIVSGVDSNENIIFYDDSKIINSNSTSYQQSNTDIEETDKVIAQHQIKDKNELKTEKSIEEILLEEEEKNKIEPKNLDSKAKFAVSTFVSPTKFFKDESILSNSFNAYEIDNKITMAYGAKFAYQINNNLKIRTGISKLDFDQNTRNVVTASNSSAQNTTIEPLNSSIIPNDNNIKYYGNLQVLTNHENYPISFYTAEKNTMNQKVEFIEIPLEIEYQFINKSRFNFSVVGGGSYMVLTKNDIFINNDLNGRSKIGKAENLNDISYSANAGLKFEYLLSDKAGINLEPTYKFLINPLKDFSNEGNSLLSIGIGLSFKF